MCLYYTSSPLKRPFMIGYQFLALDKGKKICYNMITQGKGSFF
jgi:hypothetical protein